MFRANVLLHSQPRLPKLENCCSKRNGIAYTAQAENELLVDAPGLCSKALLIFFRESGQTKRLGFALGKVARLAMSHNIEEVSCPRALESRRNQQGRLKGLARDS